MKILIVDDHFVVREGLRRLLSRVADIYIREATSPQDALVAFREDRPDLVLLDLNLPTSSGLELLKRLVLEDKRVCVLLFSMHAEPNYVVEALQAGARGYVSKGAPVEELKVINVKRTPARFRAFPDDTGITFEGNKPVACIRPILKLLDGHVIARLAADATGEESPRNIDHVRRARAFVLGRLAELPRENCWTIAEHAGDSSPDGMQHMLARAAMSSSTWAIPVRYW